MASKTIIEKRSRDLKLIPIIWMFPDQNPSIEEYTWKNWRVSLLKLLPTCTSRVIPMHAACASPMRYNPAFKEVTYTQDLLPDDLNHNLGNIKCGLWKEGGYYHFFAGGRQLSRKVIRKPLPINEYL